jgi:hypothetical protein
MHIWRFPLVNLAALLAFVTVFVAWEAVAWLRRKTKLDVARGLAGGVGIVVAVSSPLIVYAVVEPELRELRAQGVFIHYGNVFYIGPAVLAAVLFVLSRRSIPSDAPSAGVARTAFWLTATILAALNFANWCSPGWCEHFGFPIPYSWWSDAIIVMNRVNLTAGTSVLAVVADFLVLLLVARVVSSTILRRAA